MSTRYINPSSAPTAMTSSFQLILLIAKSFPLNHVCVALVATPLFLVAWQGDSKCGSAEEGDSKESDFRSVLHDVLVIRELTDVRI
jgi:hypothetical protein